MTVSWKIFNGLGLCLEHTKFLMMEENATELKIKPLVVCTFLCFKVFIAW